jgi:hypothetical protein
MQISSNYKTSLKSLEIKYVEKLIDYLKIFRDYPHEKRKKDRKKELKKEMKKKKEVKK